MIELLAHAKLTWYLEITGRREDGYHEIRSEMSTIALHDVLFVDETLDHLEVLSPFATEIETDERNLIVRALRLVGRRAGVRVEKSIPIGGGLGGGSADAAAILRWAGGVADDVAVTLGGDVPFCQLGGRALVEGVGERLSVLPHEERALTLIMPDFAVSTASSYRAYDEMRADGWRPRGPNHLEEPPAGRAEIGRDPGVATRRDRAAGVPRRIGLVDVRRRSLGFVADPLGHDRPRGPSPVVHAHYDASIGVDEGYLPAARR